MMRIGYQNGKFEYVELLDAHNTLLSIKEQYVDFLQDYHLNRAELERFTGEIL